VRKIDVGSAARRPALHHYRGHLRVNVLDPHPNGALIDLSDRGFDGVGLAVQDKGATIEVYQLKKMDGPRVKILVPKGVSVSITHSSPHGDDIKIRNCESEIESSTVHSGIKLDNVTGPLNIKTVHGEIEADFGAGIKSPIRLISTHGLVDLTLPLATKATMTMSTSWGEILVDPALKLEIETKGDMVKYSSNSVNGKLNGGGIEIELKSTHSNIYVRKK